MPDHVTVRLDAETIARLDALIPALSTPWLRARRADVLRRVILSGVIALEQLRGVKPPAGKAPRAKRPRRA